MKKILIVDDEPALVELLETELTVAGYEVVCASDGLEGLAKAIQERPHLIILDVAMPKMDGYEALRKLRSSAGTKATPVILLTAKNETNSIMEAQRLGATDYLIKPIEPEELLTMLRRYLAPNPSK